jgi:tetratricopeptide (TPR) repeat protein
VPVIYADAEVTASDAETAEQIMNEAVQHFQQNNLDAALDVVNKGISRFPDDAVLHEFRGLVLFARHDYQQAASTIHAVLAVGPGWNWTTMAGMYPSVDVYTSQLRSLEEFIRMNPDDAASRFLLSYHYLTCGHADAAARQLKRVVELKPADAVAADLLRMIEGPTESAATTDAASEQPAQQTTGAESPGTNPSPVDPATVMGSWNAKHEDGSTFQLMLNSDNKFQWSFSQPNQEAQQFAGTFSLDGDVLVLEREDGGSLVGELSAVEANGFNFKLVGAPASDPGLKFTR